MVLERRWHPLYFCGVGSCFIGRGITTENTEIHGAKSNKRKYEDNQDTKDQEEKAERCDPQMNADGCRYDALKKLACQNDPRLSAAIGRQFPSYLLLCASSVPLSLCGSVVPPAHGLQYMRL
jgi:hypothetical protein